MCLMLTPWQTLICDVQGPALLAQLPTLLDCLSDCCASLRWLLLHAGSQHAKLWPAVRGQMGDLKKAVTLLPSVATLKQQVRHEWREEKWQDRICK